MHNFTALPQSLPKKANAGGGKDRLQHGQNVDRCEEVIIDYLKNRRAVGFDHLEKSGGDFFSRPTARHYCGVFTQSKLQAEWVNGYDNGIVFVETGVADPNTASRVIRTGDFLREFFVHCEYTLQLVLSQERRSGRKSNVVCIFDMQQMSIIQYANPIAPVNKIFEARIGVFMAYYMEVLSRVVIVNPPRLLNVLLKILGRFHIAQSLPDVEKWISPDAIPTGFGGKKVVKGAELPTGCNKPIEYSKEEYLRDGMIWQKLGLDKVNYEHCVVAVGETWTRELKANAGQLLVYEYFANRNFEIKVENDEGEYLLPHFRMSTPMLAEEGSVPIAHDMRIRVEVKNLSKLMRMKLRAAFLLIN
uniref:CRAL-TRIO domain-containing protein n=1 Tax=Globodera pallida TaxID=36090 RepID=A0A183CBA7_GLOPA